MRSWGRKQAVGVERVNCSNETLRVTKQRSGSEGAAARSLFVFFSALFCVYFRGLRDAFQPTLLYAH